MTNAKQKPHGYGFFEYTSLRSNLMNLKCLRCLNAIGFLSVIAIDGYLGLFLYKN